MQTPIKKINLVTDFSDIPKEATNRTLFLDHASKAKLIVLHVLDIYAQYFPTCYFFTVGGFDKLATTQLQARQQGKAVLKKITDSFELGVETIYTEGDLGQETIRVTEKCEIDLIVLGTWLQRLKSIYYWKCRRVCY